jgi:hypothetical protein
MTLALLAALVAGAAAAGARAVPASPATAPADAPPLATNAAAPPPGLPVADAPSDGAGVEGEVLEAIQVPTYSYLRVGERGTEGTWVAVPTTTIGVGAHARVANGTKMTGFTSAKLGRTFPVIYFGTLSEAGEAPSRADPHSPLVANPHGVSPHGSQADMSSAHTPLGPVEVPRVARATGPNGKTVAEVVTQRAQLAGKTVRVHATVVKSTPGVLGHTYLHLRDGTGETGAGTHDVAVTTDAAPAVGATVVVEGVVAIDRDIGAGYKFPTIVENATVVSQ